MTNSKLSLNIFVEISNMTSHRNNLSIKLICNITNYYSYLNELFLREC